jgi:hypothetical protein
MCLLFLLPKIRKRLASWIAAAAGAALLVGAACATAPEWRLRRHGGLDGGERGGPRRGLRGSAAAVLPCAPHRWSRNGHRPAGLQPRHSLRGTSVLPAQEPRVWLGSRRVAPCLDCVARGVCVITT